MQYRKITPLDIVNFRGNKAFGEAGEHGESSMPPQPSIFAGALRSYWLAGQRIDLRAFAKGTARLPQAMAQQLGTPSEPGSFRLQQLWLYRAGEQGGEIYLPLPADTRVLPEGMVVQMQPRELPAGLATSATLPKLALLKTAAVKPLPGYWLNESGLREWLKGKPLSAQHTTPISDLWCRDMRLGIGMNAATRTTGDGQLYTSEAISLKEGVSFLAGITGAPDYPDTGQLRLGGDGRAADMSRADWALPQPDWDEISRTGRCKLLLTSPAILSGGWQWAEPAGPCTSGDGQARLACMANGRAQVISGWDMVKHCPKTAERTLPVGSVIWLEEVTASVASLQQLTKQGLELDTLPKQRRAEGYNAVVIGNWN